MFSRLAIVTCTITLAAAPALGQATAKALDQHYATLSTQAATDCGDYKYKTIQQRLVACPLALAQLAASRRAAPGLSAGQVANYDYRRVVNQTALAAAYAQADKRLSARACALLENSWAIRYRLQSVPRGALSPSAYDTFQKPPADASEILGNCRTNFPPTRGAPPLPATRPATK